MEFLKRIVRTSDETNEEGVLEPALGSVHIVLEVLAGRDLVAKDRNLLRKRTTSDPYVICYQLFKNGTKQEIGRTQVVEKDLNPTWNQKLDLILDGDDQILNDGVDLVYEIYDQDVVTNPDFMGQVTLHVDILESVKENWYPVEKGSEDDEEQYCRNATGELHLVASVTGRCIPALVAGNTLQGANITKIQFGWNNPKLDMDIGCIAIGTEMGREGELVFSESSYSANIGNKIVRRQMSEGEFDDDSNHCTFDINVMNVLTNSNDYTFCLILNEPLEEEPLVVRARVFCDCRPTAQYDFRPKIVHDCTALFRLEQHKMSLSMLDRGLNEIYDFGGALPMLCAYSETLSTTPTYHHPMAILKANYSVLVNEYISIDATPVLKFAAQWTLSDPTKDLDMAAICMNQDLERIEIVSFRQLLSRDKGIKHCGDAREDLPDDDEEIEFRLADISDSVRYIGVVVNCHSGSQLDICQKLSYRLYTTDDYGPPYSPNKDRIVHTVTDSESIQNSTGLIWAVWSRNDDESSWEFTATHIPSVGITAQETVDDLRTYLQANPTPRRCRPYLGEPELEEAPSPKPIMEVEEDVLIPAFEFKRYMAEPTIAVGNL